jgi:3'-phosphoadenosine 5'-phosphosulfate (PAPS) 3'-phosphatase
MLDRELVEAVKLAREAGAILLDVYGSDFSVRYKGEQDPVTEADTRVNSFLVGRIRESFPSDSIIAEETASSNSRATSNRCWYLDPLVGKKEFIAKNGLFSMMIGLAFDGEARLGVVYQPTEGKLYLCLFASQGHDLRALLRGRSPSGTPWTDEQIAGAVGLIWNARDDRYSELRGAQAAETGSGQRRVEMHYIGG